MTLHIAPSPIKSTAWFIVEPEFNPAQFKAATLEPDGADMCVHALLSDFEALNPTDAAEAQRRAAAHRQRELARESRRQTRSLRRTKPTRIVVSNELDANLPVFSIIEGFVLVFGAIFALYLGNLVVANYVVQSGSDLYATDPAGAGKFAMLAVLTGLAVKAFEKRLSTDAARHWYAAIFYAVGLASFAVWAVTAAQLFAPKSGSWLTSGATNQWVPIALMLAHILGDCAFGYILFSGAETLLLGNRKRVVIANPEHVLAEQRAQQAQAALTGCLAEIAEADAYLHALAHCRQKLQGKAELELDRQLAILRALEAGAQAQARFRFFNACE